MNFQNGFDFFYTTSWALHEGLQPSEHCHSGNEDSVSCPKICPWVLQALNIEPLPGLFVFWKSFDLHPTTLWNWESKSSVNHLNMIPRGIWQHPPTKSQKLPGDPSIQRSHHCDAFDCAFAMGVDSRGVQLPSSLPLESMGSPEKFIPKPFDTTHQLLNCVPSTTLMHLQSRIRN